MSKESPLPITDCLVAADYLTEAGMDGPAAVLRQAAETWLLRFCEPCSARYFFADPFVHDRHLYASDRRLAVRMPTARPGTHGETGRQMAAFFLRHFGSKLKNEEWLPWPDKVFRLEPDDEIDGGVHCPICQGEGLRLPFAFAAARGC